MIVFIDESGIHKKTDHSSFAVAYITFTNYEAVKKKLSKIEKDLNIKEFHWAETVWKVKEKFLDRALDLKFKAKIAIIKNPIKPAEELEKIPKLHDVKPKYNAEIPVYYQGPESPDLPIVEEENGEEYQLEPLA